MVLGSRGINQIPRIHRVPYLPLLKEDYSNGANVLYMEKAHRIGHEGATESLHRSRQEIWITGGR
jgi:hypothetical protein